MKKQYKKAFETLGLLRYELLLLTLILFIIEVVVIKFFSSLDPSVMTDERLRNTLDNIFGNYDIDLTSIRFQWWMVFSWVRYFVYNSVIDLIAVCTGFIPFYFLDLGIINQNTMSIGYSIGIMTLAGNNVWEIILRAYLPHGIFEIPANMVSQLLGLYLCYNTTKWWSVKFARYYIKNEQSDIDKSIRKKPVNPQMLKVSQYEIDGIVGKCFWDCMRVYGLIVLPLLLIASPIEAYVVPILMNIKLGG